MDSRSGQPCADAVSVIARRGGSVRPPNLYCRRCGAICFCVWRIQFDFVALAEVASLTENLEIGLHRFATSTPRNDMVNVQTKTGG